MKNNEITSEKKEMEKTLIDKLNNYIRNNIAF